MMRQVTTDYIVVGSGISGLMTALFLSETGEVKVLTKACEDESNSYRAQGGIAAAVGVADSPNLHWQDTLRAGVDLCDEDTVRLMVKMAPDTIRLLADWGTPFDKKGNTYLLAKEGAHSASRILRVHGDSTGAGITSTLLRQAKRRKSIHMQTHTMVADLLVENETCRGVIALDTGREPTCYLARKGVVLATGGCGQVFKYTTNDLVTTGDGFAMAHRANVQLTDMEFIQFHPTALAVDQNPMFLISEAVRGEGAVLVTESGDRFMERYHELKDLAPRDVVSRTIYTEMQQGNQVYLDARHLKGKFAHRFPAIYKKCRKAGIDPEREWIPVRPAAHFIMGGIKTDSYGRTSLPRLFACGEVACTGVHGANRLASNSLLEGTVFAQRVAEKLSSYEEQSTTMQLPSQFPRLCQDKQTEEKIKKEIRQIMWDHAGIVRTSEGLAEGLSKLKRLQDSGRVLPGMFELRNMLTTAQLVMKAARWREESRGGHYRRDFPQTIPEWAEKHKVIQGGISS
ncbi:L-aspartate oxidase [Thermoactinomyces sp. CICC 24227]|uniref:L-aspartate oxidase n=1 Tax=Thermoactinomyces sp. CICC 24227 TaxID=2767432 RepID=UPI0018DB3956|nr:L-aspartate oxidase [Thermoactinomyces sp. CICC 24227]